MVKLSGTSVTVKMTETAATRHRPVTPKEEKGVGRGGTKGFATKKDGEHYGPGLQVSLCLRRWNVPAAVS